ncbi:MAG: xanthine dehydrogenase family protein molybdopterin-binding subunit, partial [Bacteriovoracia bacterium]
NLFKSFLIEKGDVDSVWKKADGLVVLEGEYSTGAQEQLYIENNGVIATANPEDGVCVWGSLQCPYYVHKALKELFPLPEEKLRVIQAETGGGFGGKEEYPSMLAGHAALLAWKSGRPVKMIYDRSEDMVATTKRHPSRSKIRTAVTPDGKLQAIDIQFDLDGGAYLTLSPVVLSRGTIHAPGPYACPNVRVSSRALATNTPPHGAFRGFGAPQSIFAMERHLDHVAAKLGMSPVELRKKNFLKEGMTTATGQVIREPIQLDKLLDGALKLAGYHEKQKRYARENPRSPIKRGVGFATFMHGAGFTGSGERYLASVVAVEGTKDGKVRVLASSTEIGQGTKTIFSQIVARVLGLAFEDVEVAQPDTKFVPNSGPTVASRTAMVVGKLVETAALNLRDRLIAEKALPEKFSRTKFKQAVSRFVKSRGALRAEAQYKQPAGVFWDDQKYQGEAYATYAWGVYVADVAIDTRTYEIRLQDFVASQEVGKVIHPVLAAGQIEGGVAQGIGYAIYEKVVWKDGRMANNKMTNYIMPTSMDLPPIRVHFAELPSPFGPGGAKGIGELPMDGPAPAIGNAVYAALGSAQGTAANHIPLLPEDLMKGLENAGGARHG